MGSRPARYRLSHSGSTPASASSSASDSGAIPELSGSFTIKYARTSVSVIALIVALALQQSTIGPELARIDKFVGVIYSGHHQGLGVREQARQELAAAYVSFCKQGIDVITPQLRGYWDGIGARGENLMVRVIVIYALNRILFKIPPEYVPAAGVEEGPKVWKTQLNLWPWVVKPGGTFEFDTTFPFGYIEGPGLGPHPLAEFNYLRARYPLRPFK